MVTTTQTKLMALKRARLEVCHATAILRTLIHDPDAQGVLQLLTLAIDDADKVIAKLQATAGQPRSESCLETVTTGAKTNATKKTPLKSTPPSTLKKT